jgi:hypothetical protein
MGRNLDCHRKAGILLDRVKQFVLEADHQQILSNKKRLLHELMQVVYVKQQSINHSIFVV